MIPVLPSFLLAWTSGDDALEEVKRLLRRREPVDERTTTEVVGELAALGPRVIPVFFDLARGEGLERVYGESEPADWLVSPEEAGRIALLAIVRLPVEAVIEDLAGERATLEDRTTSLRILGGMHSAKGLALATEIAGSMTDLVSTYGSARHEILQAFAAILRSDRSAIDWIQGRLKELEPAVLDVAIEALGESHRPEAQAVLETCLRLGLGEERRILGQMTRLEAYFPFKLAGTSAPYLFERLRMREAPMRALACGWLGDVHELEAVPALIVLLEDSDARVRRAAHAALQRMSNVRISADQAEAWSSWYETQREWWDGNVDRLSQELVSPRPSKAAEALRDLSQRPLWHHEAARIIAESLPSIPHPTEVSACAVLGSLASRHALPGLIDALEQRNPQLRSAAWQALRAISGENLGLDVAAWRERLTH